MRKLFVNFLWASVVGLTLSGCYPAGPDYVEDLDVVYTDHDPNFDFKSKSTYAIPDQIVVDIDRDGNPVYMNSIFADPILKSINEKMVANGWTKVDISQNPDVAFTPAGIKSTTLFYTYWYDWWYGGYYPGWGWGYPPYYSVSSITTGTLIFVIAAPSEESPVQSQAWLATMSGVLTGSYTSQRVESAIDQAFKQSPYLKLN